MGIMIGAMNVLVYITLHSQVLVGFISNESSDCARYFGFEGRKVNIALPKISVSKWQK